jgi:hypothetical protein
LVEEETMKAMTAEDKIQERDEEIEYLLEALREIYQEASSWRESEEIEPEIEGAHVMGIAWEAYKEITGKDLSIEVGD